MCFPRLKESFCCCSLRTGVFLVAWFSLLWNIFFLYVEPNHPLILQFLDEEHGFNLVHTNFSQYSRLYYVTEVMVFTFALIGIYSSSTCCLNLLIGGETVVLLIYFLMTLVKVNHNIARMSSPFSEEAVEIFLILVWKYYSYLVIISFYYEISNGNDGRTSGGRVITVPAYTTPPPTAPVVADLHIPSAPYVDTPYAIQPPHAPIISQPCPMYPPNPQYMPQVPIQTDSAPCAPPPYPFPQVGIVNEKPPPYAP